MNSSPSVEVAAEADRLMQGLARMDVVARLLGGLGVAAHRHGDSPSTLDRTYGDIDIVVPRGTWKPVAAALDELGYEGNKRFNALHGDRRMVFHDREHGRQLDVLVGTFAMCHALELDGRLDTGTTTLTPADLLLTKLQVVHVNHKDLLDAVTLLHHHELDDDAATTADVIDLARLDEVCARDWGWYTTVTDNLPKAAAVAGEVLPAPDAAQVAAKIDAITQALAGSPKPLRWKARARLGRRVSWYELPEEIGGAIGG